MMEHDDTVGTLLKALDDMGIANDTIVVYSSDNGPHMNTWPDGAMTWFRSETNTNWEGAFRVPCLVRWPAAVKPGTVTNEIMSHNDWIPTLCAVAGEPDIVNKLKAGYIANGISYKVHLDGYDQSQFLRNVSGTAANNNGTKSARDNFFYSDDDGLLVGLRKGGYKYVFSEQRMQGTMGLWAALHHAPAAEDIQPDAGSVRAGGHHVQHLLGLANQPCRRRLWHDGRCLPVRGDVQGVSASLVPAELQSRKRHGKHDGQHQGEEGADRGAGYGPDSRRREPDDRTAAPAARRQIACTAYRPARAGPV
jgi:Sulfatase